MRLGPLSQPHRTESSGPSDSDQTGAEDSIDDPSVSLSLGGVGVALVMRR